MDKLTSKIINYHRDYAVNSTSDNVLSIALFMRNNNFVIISCANSILKETLQNEKKNFLSAFRLHWVDLFKAFYFAKL